MPGNSILQKVPAPAPRLVIRSTSPPSAGAASLATASREESCPGKLVSSRSSIADKISAFNALKGTTNNIIIDFPIRTYETFPKWGIFLFTYLRN